MKFKNFIFQAWKVMEFNCRSRKVMENVAADAILDLITNVGIEELICLG